MRALDFSVQLRRAAFDVRVANALVGNMPVEFDMEFMPVIDTNFADAEWELSDDVIDEADRISL